MSTLTLREQIDQTKRDLGLALVAAKISRMCNDARIEALKLRLERLNIEQSRVNADSLACLKRMEARHAVTRKPEPLLVPMGADEYPGTGRDNGWLMERGERVRRL